jgi:histone deacetylase 11
MRDFDIPVVFCDRFAIELDIISEFFGDDRLQNHPIDFHKFEKIAKILKAKFGRLYTNIEKISDEELLLYHDSKYIKALSSEKAIIENIFRSKLPEGINAAVLNRFLVDPARYMTAGTVAASRLAMEHGWAINLGGGFHHAKKDMGSGFCFFNDYAIASIKLRNEYPNFKILYVDFDAHLGDGIILFAKDIENFYILDIYNAFTDLQGRRAVIKSGKNGNFTLIGIESYAADELYLSFIKEYLPRTIESVKPDFIFYNGGGDILMGDMLGHLSISKQGMVDRDMIVFNEAKKRNIPIAMCLSGGYGKDNYKSVADSLTQLIERI